MSSALFLSNFFFRYSLAIRSSEEEDDDVLELWRLPPLKTFRKKLKIDTPIISTNANKKKNIRPIMYIKSI